MPVSESEIRTGFFQLLFEDEEGFLCLATSDKSNPKLTFQQRFFEYPKDWRKVEQFILDSKMNLNVYFCVNLLKKQERKKENCKPTSLVWADLDSANPEQLGQFVPPILVQSSTGRWQAFWRMSTQLPPLQAEEYSRRIAYSISADKSGWDLTQLFRVPLTYNFKYDPPVQVRLEHAGSAKMPPLLFEKLLQPTVVTEIAIPDDSELPNLEAIIYKYSASLRNSAFEAIYTQEPDDGADWSSILWRLHHICLAAGMSIEETFVIARSAPCNKYARDGRPEEHLWQEIIKAEASRHDMNIPDSWQPLHMPKLVDSPASETFIDKYREWATEATDAIEEFHNLAAFMVLSSVISTSVRLPCSYHPNMVPNIWGMILGDSTLSRKTTAMGMARDLIMMPDDEVIVATDGSPEGLLSALEMRPNKTSVFLVDEVSGFFNSMNRKEYQAGMRETLTYLYDAPPVITRTLRSSKIIINSPAFILFCGGITDHVHEAVGEDYVISGFLPRFLVVSGTADMSKIRDTFRPAESTTNKHTAIKADVADLYELYASEIPIKVGNATMMQSPRIHADLTDKAWGMYGSIERKMRTVAADYQPNRTIALPTFERLSRSLLKMSVLLAASRQEPTEHNKITVDVDDLTNAAWYVQNWGEHSIELIMNAGTNRHEKRLTVLLGAIMENPGMLRSRIMQRFRMSKKEADEIFGTLVDRGLVKETRNGSGGKVYFPN